MNSSLIKTHITGGGERFRTDDLLLAKQALYLLSYTPFSSPSQMVGLTGVEPVTSSLSGTRSNQLSYKPRGLVEAAGFEPATSCLQSRRSTS